MKFYWIDSGNSEKEEYAEDCKVTIIKDEQKYVLLPGKVLTFTRQ